MDKDDLFVSKLLRLGCLFAAIWDHKNTVGGYISPIEDARKFEAYVSGDTNADQARD